MFTLKAARRRAAFSIGGYACKRLPCDLFRHSKESYNFRINPYPPQPVYLFGWRNYLAAKHIRLLSKTTNEL
jgi:hypothetical protein